MENMDHKVNFLMPVAAPAPFLQATLESLRSQSFDDWGLTAVIDGRSPEVERVISAAIPAERLLLVRLQERQGISRALNAGLGATRSELVARIDADDVNFAHRLDLQVRFMDAHPEVLVLGGAALLIDHHGEPVGELPVRHGSDIRRELLVKNRLVHSSVMLRRDLVVGMGGYNARCMLREDYELWLRLAAAGPVANLPQNVVKYRLNAGQVSRRPMPAISTKYVSAARIDAARTLGVSRVAATAMNIAWAGAQNEQFKARFGSLVWQRRRHGLE